MMTTRQFVFNVDKVVSEAQTSLSLKLAKGSIRNMEEYHRQVGRIEGLGEGLKLIKDMLGKLEDDERESSLGEMVNE